MADNVLKIIFEEAGGAARGPGGGPSGTSSASSGVGGPGSAARQQFDPAAEAQKMLVRDRQAAQTREQFNLMKYGTPGSPADRAREQRETLAGRVQAVQGTAAVAQRAGIPMAGEMGSVATAAMAGGPVGIVVAVATAAISAVKAIDAKIMEVAKDAGQYSPQAQVASAQAEVRRVQGDLRRSQEIGPALAKMTEAESKLDEAIRDFWTDPDWLEFKANIMEFLARAVKSTGEVRKGVGDVTKVMLGASLTLRQIDQNTKKEISPMDDDPFLTDLANMNLKIPQEEGRAFFRQLQNL